MSVGRCREKLSSGSVCWGLLGSVCLILLALAGFCWGLMESADVCRSLQGLVGACTAW